MFSRDSSGVDFSHFKSAIVSIITMMPLCYKPSERAPLDFLTLDYTTCKDDVIKTLGASLKKNSD